VNLFGFPTNRRASIVVRRRPIESNEHAKSSSAEASLANALSSKIAQALQKSSTGAAKPALANNPFSKQNSIESMRGQSPTNSDHEETLRERLPQLFNPDESRLTRQRTQSMVIIRQASTESTRSQSERRKSEVSAFISPAVLEAMAGQPSEIQRSDSVQSLTQENPQPRRSGSILAGFMGSTPSITSDALSMAASASGAQTSSQPERRRMSLIESRRFDLNDILSVKSPLPPIPPMRQLSPVDNSASSDSERRASPQRLPHAVGGPSPNSNSASIMLKVYPSSRILRRFSSSAVESSPGSMRKMVLTVSQPSPQLSRQTSLESIASAASIASAEEQTPLQHNAGSSAQPSTSNSSSNSNLNGAPTSAQMQNRRVSNVIPSSLVAQRRALGMTTTPSHRAMSVGMVPSASGTSLARNSSISTLSPTSERRGTMTPNPTTVIIRRNTRTNSIMPSAENSNGNTPKPRQLRRIDSSQIDKSADLLIAQRSNSLRRSSSRQLRSSLSLKAADSAVERSPEKSAQFVSSKPDHFVSAVAVTPDEVHEDAKHEESKGSAQKAPSNKQRRRLSFAADQGVADSVIHIEKPVEKMVDKPIEPVRTNNLFPSESPSAAPGPALKKTFTLSVASRQIKSLATSTELVLSGSSEFHIEFPSFSTFEPLLKSWHIQALWTTSTLLVSLFVALLWVALPVVSHVIVNTSVVIVYVMAVMVR
jgi:hypothetical protein